MADGGEGTLDAAVGSGFTRRSASVSGPTGAAAEADFAVRGREAVIEMAAASGLRPAALRGVRRRPRPVGRCRTATSLAPAN